MPSLIIVTILYSNTVFKQDVDQALVKKKKKEKHQTGIIPRVSNGVQGFWCIHHFGYSCQNLAVSTLLAQ